MIDLLEQEQHNPFRLTVPVLLYHHHQRRASCASTASYAFVHGALIRQRRVHASSIELQSLLPPHC